jgi:hypothetical protein
MATGLISEPTEGGYVFQLERQRALSGKSPLPVSDWITAAGGGEIAGVSQLLSWVEDEKAFGDAKSVTVPHDIIASLDAASAHGLSLAPSAPYVLDVQHIGIISQPEFRFKATWLQTNGQPVPGLKRMGSALKVGTRHFRIPEPLYGIVESCETFNAAASRSDIDERFRIWARMSKLFPDETNRSVRLGNYLSSTRVAHAASFSLALHSGPQGFTFEPILFGPDLARTDENGSLEVPYETDSLLPPSQQTLFAQKRFVQSTECQAHYALGEGWYVVLDEPVRQALNVVRRAQLTDAETRKQFVRNPRTFLAKALGEKISADVLESLFIETAEYSGRVRDVGVWQPKVLPWIKKPPEPWIPPEKFGVRVGDRTIALEAREIASLREAVSDAISKNETSVNWKSDTIPASKECISALDALVGEVIPESRKPDAKDGFSDISAEFEHEEPEAEKAEQYVLEIYDHFSEVEYQPGRVKRPSLPDIGIPTRLKTSLKGHQQEGLDWLQRAWTSGLRGVLLADDMGLGKTLQALTFLAWLREAMELGRLRSAPILIVAPTGLLKNWEQEHDQHLHSPGLGDVVRAFGRELANIRLGTGRETGLGQATLDADRLGHADWILTTYETLRDYQHSFCSIRYGAVVFDEMQKIKTPGIVMTQAAKALNADFMIGLTGTPVENRLADLWCLIDTLQPGLLKDLSSFSRTYEREENLHELGTLKAALSDPTPDSPQIMLRRMKADKLPGLPPKIEHLLEEPMSGLQASAYDDAIKAARTEGGGGSKMLETLHNLRSISLHPFHPSAATDDKYVDASARFKVTMGVLDKIAEKREKALIFVESQEMQPYLAAFLQRRYKLRTLPMLINGTVAGAKRQERVNLFQTGAPGFDVIILSPRAGGVGLTLTAANHVIHLSRWWNPAVEDQCTDRVHRIGQKANEVHVYYPLAVHPSYGDQSFDRRLHALLEKRRHLSRELLLPPTDPGDTKDLFEQTVGGDANYFNIGNIDSMEPIQFENWVLQQLGAVGHRVSRTPKTGDGGADGVAHHRLSGRPFIIQCKHTQGTTSPDAAISDLLRARTAYSNLESPGLIAITNAPAFGRSARETAKSMGIITICRDDLSSWPPASL